MTKVLYTSWVYLIITFIFAGNVPGQSCEECQTRNLVIFDNNINIPRPTGPDSVLATAIPKWWDLFYISGGEDKYFRSDPTSECFIKLCNAFFVVQDTIVHTIKHGEENPNCAPSGTIGGVAEYILSGTVTGDGKNYKLSLSLETAKTREVVQTATQYFTDGFDPFETGKSAAMQFGPLYQTIMDFEKKKRDSGDEYAINPTIEVKAERTELKAKESTDIEFTLKDCDGTLLKNRKIDLSNVKLGQFDPAEVTTDDQGKAKSKFTAGDVKGTAVISAVNSYKRAYATGEFASEGGTAFIQIEEPPHWMAEGDYKWSSITNEVYSGFGSQSKEENYRMEEGAFVSTFKVKENFGDYFSENPPVAVLSQGKSITRTKYDYLMSIPQTGSIRENNLEECIGNQSLIADAEVGVAFFSSGDKQIQFTSKTPMTFNGSIHNYKQTCDVLSGCSVEENNQDCSNMELNLSFGLEAGDITIITDTTYYGMGLKVNETRKLQKTTAVTGNKYKFTYLTNSTIQMFYNELGTAYKITTEKYAVNIDVTAPGFTGVEKKTSSSPTEYNLFQNYPNPFNPATTISYKIPTGNFVSLKIYNPLGEEVKTLVNDYQDPGLHSVKFNAGSLPSGIYVYRLKAGNFVDSKKFILMK